MIFADEVREAVEQEMEAEKREYYEWVYHKNPVLFRGISYEAFKLMFGVRNINDQT
jgi:hypothetical protein